ncbi:unnamed protein product, partial [Ixodes hexagonus]
AETFSWEGTVLASSASIFWGLVAVMVKLSPSLSTSKLIFHFSLGIFVGVTTCQSGVPVLYGPLSAQRKLVVHSVLATSSIFARFFCLRYLSLMNSYALGNVGPALTLIPEYLFKGPEVLTFSRLFAVAMMGVGVCLIIHTNLSEVAEESAAHNFSVGCGLALTSAFLRAVQREFSSLDADIPSVMRLFHWSFLALLTSCAVAIWNGDIGQIFGDSDMGALVFLSQVSFAFVYFVSKARESGDYGVVNMCLYSGDLVLAIVASLVYLREDTRPLSYVAAVMVLASVFCAELSKRKAASLRQRAGLQRV